MFTAAGKQLVRQAAKCEKEEKTERLKIKKAIEKGGALHALGLLDTQEGWLLLILQHAGTPRCLCRGINIGVYLN